MVWYFEAKKRPSFPKALLGLYSTAVPYSSAAGLVVGFIWFIQYLEPAWHRQLLQSRQR
jgi:hypothetical protein